MKEAELSPIVTDWLKRQGFRVYAEVPFFRSGHGYGTIDLVGYARKRRKLVVIELKLNASYQLHNQCYRGKAFTKFVYGAVPVNPKQSSVKSFSSQGIGLLHVTDEVRVVLEPKEDPSRYAQKVVPRERAKLIKRLETHPEGGIGGKACHAPALECFKRVIAYRKQNPKSTWKEIFSNVPNHYASHNSMRQALRAQEDWPDRKKILEQEGLNAL